MPGYKTQSIPYFNHINHIYYLMEAIRLKDHIYICRHFLWLINNPRNQPITTKAIRSIIYELTKDFGIDNQSIGNALHYMTQNGEIERFKNQHNKAGWNDDVTNRSPYTHYIPIYAGKPLRPYTEAEQILVKILIKKYVRTQVPRSEEDLKNTIALIENESLKQEKIKMNTIIDNLIQQLEAKDKQLDRQSNHMSELTNLLTRILCGEKVPDKEIKGHLISIKGGKIGNDEQ